MTLSSQALHRPVQKLRKLLRTLPKRPAPQEVHDLRTNTRRVEAAMSALQLRQKRTLDPVRKAAGKVRDMDVLIHFASLLHPDGEDDCSVRLIEHLGEKRLSRAKHLHAVVAKYRGRARRRLKKTDARFDRVDHPDERALAAAQALERQLTLTPLGRRTLHPYRLTVKALRNTLRLDTGADAELLRVLGDVKDAIGDWHDWEALRTLAHDVLQHPRCALLRELTSTCDEKYATALAKARKLQRSQVTASRAT